jgi:uncharacterized protein (DUF2147 family)
MTKANIKHTMLLLSLMLTGTAALAQSPASLGGIWRLQDGSATVRVTSCNGNGNTWCATVIEERLQPGEPSMMNQSVVRDMRPNGKQGWSGRYVVDGQSMKATAKLLRADQINFKICAVAFLCDTIRLDRVRN